MRVRLRLNCLYRGEDAVRVELDEHFWLVMVGRGEANAVFIAVMDRVIKLHKDIANDVHLFKAHLIDSERFDNVSAFASLGVVAVDFARYPVV